MLHWSTDPLLLDKEPIKYNDWLTANEIIQKKGMQAVLTKDLTFTNIYGIMVRKIDFVRLKSSDRIIARFPFLKITDSSKEQITKNILSLSEIVRDYFYKSINKTITQWEKIIREYLEKGSLPFPLFRCAQELFKVDIQSSNNHITFTSARGEAFTFPVKLTTKLAYLCGICNGDGNLRDYWIIVADETKKHIEFISSLLMQVFSKAGKLILSSGAWTVKLNLLWAVRLFNFLTDQAIDVPKYNSLREPLLLKKLGNPFRSMYWRGAYDSDGTFKTQMNFCSASKHFVTDFSKFLFDLGINNKVKSMKHNAYIVLIPSRYKFHFAETIGSSHPKKINDFIQFLFMKYPRKLFQGINKIHLTQNGQYFNFQLLPTMQIIGLDSYLDKQGISSTLTKKYKYQPGQGITIRILSNVLGLSQVPQIFMKLLAENQSYLSYRSGSSSTLTLPTQPSQNFETIMKKISPTARGISIIEDYLDSNLIHTIESLFSVQVVDKNKVRNKLLSKFLITFGDYHNIDLTEKITRLKKQWKISIS